jgi:putative nucleotidyltransferase with HDIG domain
MSTFALYPVGHATRGRALDDLYQALIDILATTPKPLFSFLGDQVIFGKAPLRGFEDWEWSKRLAGIGVQRLEFDATATRGDLDAFVDDLLHRITQKGIDTSEIRQMRPSGIRFGTVGLKDQDKNIKEIETATLDFTLGEEAETLRWMHEEVTSGHDLPLTEAQAVVRSLSLAMHGQQHMMLPLLKIREYDEYTTTHSLNVSVLTMALAEWMSLGARDVQAFGIAGLLHDIGKVVIPLEILNKPGALSDEERAIIKSHTVEGARIIIATEQDLDMASVVAYEHHIMINGEGYPSLAYPRDCHYGSKLVHVCDVYDALRTKRPYRDAWPPEQVLAYIEERSGLEFDGVIAHAFCQMMRTWEPNLVRVTEREPIPMNQPADQSSS